MEVLSVRCEQQKNGEMNEENALTVRRVNRVEEPIEIFYPRAI
jgi:hypothetical protein